MLLKKCEVRTGKILVEFFFFFAMNRAAGEVHKLARKEPDQYFPSKDRTSHFNKGFSTFKVAPYSFMTFYDHARADDASFSNLRALT